MPSGIYKHIKGVNCGFNKGKHWKLSKEIVIKMSERQKGHRWALGKKWSYKENLGYRGLHHWVWKMLGKPLKCELCGKTKTTPKSIHWANKSGNYFKDITDWISLCASCHKHYDGYVREN